MLVAASTRTLPRPLVRPCVAIGNFDGVHRGHQALLEAARLKAAELDGDSVVLTFDPHPAAVVRPGGGPPLLTTTAQRVELLAAAGITATIVVPFDAALASLAPNEFVQALLVNDLVAAHVTVGSDFRFGQGRRGDPSQLVAAGAAAGFGVSVIDKVSVDGEMCSSSAIRAHLTAGNITAANRLLGRRYALMGEVVHGQKRGRAIGFPTANLGELATLVPAEGVYAALAQVGARRFVAAVSIGRNPTFVDGGPRTVEAYLLDFDEDIYGQPLRLAFDSRLRAEAKFDSLDALLVQMHDDVARTRQLIALDLA